MRYMLLIFSNPENWATMTEADQHALFGEYEAFTQSIRASGEWVSGDPLTGPDTASVVRVRDGGRAITDGPFVESKEFLAGYYVVEVAGLDRALELAAQIPEAKSGAIEVRPLAAM